MKKGIEAWPDRDFGGTWCLKIKKKKGKLTLDEIRETLTEWEEDNYCILMRCTGDLDNFQNFGEEDAGDFVTAYKFDDLRKF